MKNRLISLLLISLMILLCFAGCAEKTGDEIKEQIGEEASKDAIRLSMYLMSEEKVSDKQLALMEEKVNELTEAKYKIHLELEYATPEEYYTKLETNLAKMKEHYKGGNAGKTPDDPKYTNENGLPQIHYPAIEPFDVDIFYFNGYEKYVEYKENGYLRNLDEEFAGSSKALKAVINNTLVEQFKSVNGSYFAVPTNRAIGEYTYLLLNKDVLDTTKYSAKDIDSLVSDNCQDLLDMVATETELKDFVPLYSSTGELDTLGVKYFGTNAAGLPNDEFSVIGGTYNTSWKVGAQNSFPEMNSIFASKDNGLKGAKEQIDVLNGYKAKGYYGSEADKEKAFAVGYITGGPEVVEQYADDYEIVVVKNPTLVHEDLYENMFGVAHYTNSVSGSMEILTYLNTDEEFRNLLLYGVEGENYTWVDSEEFDANGNPYRVVSRNTKDPDKLYTMDAFKTGNVAIAYPAVGEDPVAGVRILEQNADLVVDYVLGFSFYDGLKAGKIDKASFDALVALDNEAAAIYAELLVADTQEKIDAAMAKFDALVAGENFAKAMNTEEGSTSPLAYYNQWLVEKKLLVIETEEK